jgi:hypothetical protein
MECAYQNDIKMTVSRDNFEKNRAFLGQREKERKKLAR